MAKNSSRPILEFASSFFQVMGREHTSQRVLG
jgi:hypothetical protein